MNATPKPAATPPTALGGGDEVEDAHDEDLNPAGCELGCTDH